MTISIAQPSPAPIQASHHINGPIRILHVLGGLDQGGIETWLMHVLRQVDRRHIQMDFLVHDVQAQAYCDIVQTFGSRVIPCPNPERIRQYGQQFKQILHQYGPYDIVHSHVHYFSGYTLRIAKQYGVPVRIAHSHNDTTVAESNAGIKRRLYLRLMQSWIARHATHGLACSRDAAQDLFGPRWQQDSRWQVLPYGIDLSSYYGPVDRPAVRAELGIPPDAFVVGHVGRFVEQKNHHFLLQIAAELAAQIPNFRLLLIGKGELKPAIQQQVDTLQINDHVIFAGTRSDIPQVMQGAMDLFLFPSHHEGLGIVLLEAQAAGLACVISDVIPREVDVVSDLIQRLNLEQSPRTWASYVKDIQNKIQAKTIPTTDALTQISHSPYNIVNAAHQLFALYHEAMQREVLA